MIEAHYKLRTHPMPTRPQALPRRTTLAAVALAALASVTALPAAAEGPVLNLYSARHYQTDEALYANFTKTTGIKINRLDGKEDELVERIRNEGSTSPADILITVDAARLEVADSLGLFQPLHSKLLDARIPANLRTPNWVAFSTRARVIVFNRRRSSVSRCKPMPTWPSRRSRARCACARAAIPTT